MPALQMSESIADYRLSWQQCTRVARGLKRAGYGAASVRWLYDMGTISKIADALEPYDEERCKKLVHIITVRAGIRPEEI